MKHPTKKHEEGQHQRWQGYALLAAVAVALAFEATSSLTYAYGEGGRVAAGLATIVILGLMALPWGNWLTGGLRALCVFLTLFAAMNNLSAQFGSTMNGRTAQAEKNLSAKDDAERARQTLGRITETGAVADLEAIVANAKTAYDTAAARDTKRNGDEPACFKTCRELLAALQTAQERLGQAKTRDQADADLKAATRLQHDTPYQDTNTLAASVAPYVQVDEKKLARTFIFWFCLAGVIVVTGIATLGQRALKMIESGQPRPKGGQGPKGGKPMPAQTEAQASNVVSIADEKKKRATPKTAPQKEAKNAVLKAQLAALLAKGLSVNEAARQIDWSKRSTFQRWAKNMGQPEAAKKSAII